ncbi:hypothetical protein Pan44_26110 [Caulifigura coniformis]|uniref:Carboxypeptidase regulatory-like domain-containing protein n=1 Tax=Caulifigura coniformis TaxID=2527983 RepID=A0A517SEP9_9PLAN|nr:hypothetical protein [Caulifigura coniformis]QDT54578.1 hypothetical protein Pan44_26110 [Caulifigura coniformis]
MSTRERTVWALLALAVFSGCGESELTLANAGGAILLDGKPLENVRVEFWPVTEGPQSAGLTNEEGKFVLATIDDDKPGAVLGKHKVVLRDVSIVEKFMGRAGGEMDLTKGKKPRISSKYANVTLTPLEAEVTADGQDLKFEVEPFKK